MEKVTIKDIDGENIIEIQKTEKGADLDYREDVKFSKIIVTTDKGKVVFKGNNRNIYGMLTMPGINGYEKKN